MFVLSIVSVCLALWFCAAWLAAKADKDHYRSLWQSAVEQLQAERAGNEVLNDALQQSESRLATQRETIIRQAKTLGIKIAPLLLMFALQLSAIAQEVSPRPEDGGRCYMVVVTHAAAAPHELQLLDNLTRDPNLVAIKNQMHFLSMKDTDTIYRERFAKVIPPHELPAVWISRPDGGVLYKATGTRVPTAAADLFDEMAHYCSLDPLRSPRDSQLARPINQDCPDGRCPVPPDNTNPLPWLNPTQPSGIVPDTSELLNARQPVKNSLAAIAWIVGGVAALFIFAFAGVILLAVLYIVAKVVRR